MTLLLLRAALHRRRLLARSDRGDVPGWVLITVMTAGLVTLVWGVADDQLTEILTNALDAVRAP